ncbi:MAG: NADH-quinone oxidoreductase subunit C [Nitrososphaerales archaeon]
MQPADLPQKAPAPIPPAPPAGPPVTTAGPSVPTAGPATPPPDTTRTKALADQIVTKFPSTKVDYAREKRLKVTVPPEQIKEAAYFLRDVLGFDHLTLVGGTDYMQQHEFEVIYFVGSISKPGQQDLVVQLAERVKRDDSPKVPSLTEVWGGAEYHERETYEMLGIAFEGHPDLRRLLLPEDWNDIPPLRKDYVSPGR